MVEGRWVVAAAAGLVVVLVSIAMVVGFQDDPPPSDRRSPSRRAAPRAETSGETEAEPAPEGEESWADEEAPPVEGLRELSGTVTNKASQTLEGVELEIAEFGTLRTVSDGDGRFRIHSVPTAPQTLLARATGYAEARIAIKRGEPAAVDTLDVVLEDGDGVAGTVVNPDGSAVQGARVGCADDVKRQQEVRTDRYGRFELPEESTGCEGVASYQGFDDSAPVYLELGTGNLLVLAKLASIAGVVADAEGRVPRSFVIAIDSFTPAAGGNADKRYRQTFSNPRGSFTVRGLKAGSYTFTVDLPGGKQLRTQPITVKRGEQKSGLTISAR